MKSAGKKALAGRGLDDRHAGVGMRGRVGRSHAVPILGVGEATPNVKLDAVEQWAAEMRLNCKFLTSASHA